MSIWLQVHLQQGKPLLQLQFREVELAQINQLKERVSSEGGESDTNITFGTYLHQMELELHTDGMRSFQLSK